MDRTGEHNFLTASVCKALPINPQMSYDEACRKCSLPASIFCPKPSSACGRNWRKRPMTLRYMAAQPSRFVWGTDNPSTLVFLRSNSAFEPGALLRQLPYLKGAVVRQSAANTLTVTVDRGGQVQLSFFGGLDLGQVAPVERANGPGLKVAALMDLAGRKAAVVTQRAEPRDYLDIHVLMTKADISLAEMLAAGTTIYGAQFSPLLSLKAIAYHDDPALAGLSRKVRHDLIEAVKATDPQHLPALNAVRRREAQA